MQNTFVWHGNLWIAGVTPVFAPWATSAKSRGRIIQMASPMLLAELMSGSLTTQRQASRKPTCFMSTNKLSAVSAPAPFSLVQQRRTHFSATQCHAARPACLATLWRSLFSVVCLAGLLSAWRAEGATAAITINCPSNIVTYATGPNGAVVYFYATAYGGCSSLNVTYSPSSGSVFPWGTTSVTATARDNCGNSTSCSFTVTVNPHVPITINCPSNITTSATGPNGAVVYFYATAYGGCDALSLTYNPPSGSVFPWGTTMVTATASDQCGNSNRCIFAVTVNQHVPITINCPSNINTSATGPNGAVVYFYATAYGGCDALSLTYNPPSGSVFPYGTTMVTATASDQCGNSNSCTFAVTVSQHVPIAINCPSNITTSATGPNGAVVYYYATAYGGCDALSLTYNPPSGSVFPYGTTPVTATASDRCGNSNSCTFAVTVNQHVPITINCPSNITTAATGPNGAVVYYYATAYGGCDALSRTYSPPSGSVFPSGTTTVLATASDQCGNSNTCAFTVTVNQHVPVTINCPSNITTTATGPNGAVVYFSATVFGGCTTPSLTYSPPSGSLFPSGTTPVLATASDACGNSNSCTFTVTVTSQQADLAVNIGTSTAVASLGSNFTYMVTVTNLGPASASGVTLYDSLPVNLALTATNISQGSLAVDGTDVTASLGFLAVGATATITMSGAPTDLNPLQHLATVSTDSNDPNPANDVDVAQTVVAQAPQLDWQPDSVQSLCGHFVEFNVSAIGTAPLSYQWLRDGAPIPGATDNVLNLGQVGTANNSHQYSARVSNAFGSVTTSNALLSVVDAVPPQLLCPDTITVPCAGGGGARVSFNVTATDNCDPNVTAICVPPSGSFFLLGSNWVQCSAVDASGNSNACGFAVIVVDTVPPSITVPAPILVYCSAQGGGAQVSYTVTASDDCDPNVALVCTPPSGSVFPLGETLVQCVATDSSGNTAIAEFPVTVIDPSPVPMTIEQEGTNVVVCWPVACASYQLYVSYQLGPTNDYWSPVPLPQPLPVENGHYCVTLPILAQNVFFQLQGKAALNSVIAKADGKKETLANQTKPVAFTAEVTSQNCGGNTFAWDFGDGGTSTQQNPTHAYATTGTFTAKVTVTCTADPTQKKSDSAKVIVPQVQITREDGTDVAATETNIVAIQAVYRSKITPALPGANSQWFIGGNTLPKKDVAISVFTNLLYEDDGTALTRGLKELEAAELQKDTLKVFFTQPQAPNLRYEITKDGKTYVAQTALQVVHDPDPNRNIYARTDVLGGPGKPDSKRNPDGAGGIYEVTPSHRVWHGQGGAKGKYDERWAIEIFQKADTMNDADRDRLIGFRGLKWFDYHGAMIKAYNDWSSTFHVPNPVDKTRGPAPPSYFTAAGGTARSPVYKFVRLDEYEDANQLGVDVHPWHIAGHVNTNLTGNALGGAALPAAQALPGIGSPANNVCASNNIFWAWHGRLEDFRATVPMAAAPAKMTATAPAANANVPAAFKLKNIFITFDKPVSYNGPTASASCARPTSLKLTPPGGGKPIFATGVGWDGANSKTLLFSVPECVKAGVWTVALAGNTRGFQAVNFQFTVTK
jgi:uncharacterized repeat protein (TIGR01451 family)